MDSKSTFLDDRALAGRRSSTLDRYELLLGEFESWLGDAILKATRQDLKRYLGHHRQTRSPNGAAFVNRHLRSFYRWALSEGLINDDPSVGLSVKIEPLPHRTASDDGGSATGRVVDIRCTEP